MPISVKRYYSGMTGAPTLSGTAGALIALLDACLKDGFNVKAPTGATQTSGTATLSFSSSHGYAPGDVIALSGANESAWNDEFLVLTTTTNSLTFAIGAGTTSPATGTLSCKIAPLGWTKPFSGTNKGAYLPKAQYVQCYLRVLDDSTVPTSANGRWAKVRGYESMSDVDTGTGPFPTVAQAANALSIMKSSTSDSAARPWWLAGDGGIFYMGTAWNVSYTTYFSGYAFGDPASLRSGDAFSALLMADQAGSDTIPSYPASNNFFSTIGTLITVQSGKYLARTYDQSGSAVAGGLIGDNAISAILGKGGISGLNLPNDGFMFAPVGVVESSYIRSRALPGLYQPLHDNKYTHLDIAPSSSDLPNRTLQIFNLAYSNFQAQCLIDVTGPWR